MSRQAKGLIDGVGILFSAEWSKKLEELVDGLLDEVRLLKERGDNLQAQVDALQARWNTEMAKKVDWAWSEVAKPFPYQPYPPPVYPSPWSSAAGVDPAPILTSAGKAPVPEADYSSYEWAKNAIKGLVSNAKKTS